MANLDWSILEESSICQGWIIWADALIISAPRDLRDNELEACSAADEVLNALQPPKQKSLLCKRF
jgi:hypothetical protein